MSHPLTIPTTLLAHGLEGDQDIELESLVLVSAKGWQSSFVSPVKVVLKPANLRRPSPDSVDATKVLEKLEPSMGAEEAGEDPHRLSGVERQKEGMSENWMISDRVRLSDTLTGVER